MKTESCYLAESWHGVSGIRWMRIRYRKRFLMIRWRIWAVWPYRSRRRMRITRVVRRLIRSSVWTVRWCANGIRPARRWRVRRVVVRRVAQADRASRQNLRMRRRRRRHWRMLCVQPTGQIGRQRRPPGQLFGFAEQNAEELADSGLVAERIVEHGRQILAFHLDKVDQKESLEPLEGHLAVFLQVVDYGRIQPEEVNESLVRLAEHFFLMVAQCLDGIGERWTRYRNQRRWERRRCRCSTSHNSRSAGWRFRRQIDGSTRRVDVFTQIKGSFHVGEEIVNQIDPECVGRIEGVVQFERRWRSAEADAFVVFDPVSGKCVDEQVHHQVFWWITSGFHS